jgi:hypothetical protein
MKGKVNYKAREMMRNVSYPAYPALKLSLINAHIRVKSSIKCKEYLCVILSHKKMYALLLIKMLGILPIDNREQSEKRAAAKLQAR